MGKNQLKKPEPLALVQLPFLLLLGRLVCTSLVPVPIHFSFHAATFLLFIPTFTYRTLVLRLAWMPFLPLIELNIDPGKLTTELQLQGALPLFFSLFFN